MEPDGQSSHRIRAGGLVAEVHTRGAALVGLQSDDIPLMVAWNESKSKGRYQGSIIAPWPNRVEDGRYRFKGQEYLLPINETSRRNALHGFSAEETWNVFERNEHELSLSCLLEAQKGYPWTIRLEARYTITPNRVQVKLKATNCSSTTAPFGAGFHPYFVLPESKRSNWRLSVNAEDVVIPDASRLLPVRLQAVVGSEHDFRSGAHLRHQKLDHAFGPNKAGASASIDAHTGSPRICIEGDTNSPWMQIHTPTEGDSFANSLVMEPTTCPPNAFRTGVDLLEMAPSSSVTTTWQIHIASPVGT